jgi:hypothetical protein
LELSLTTMCSDLNPQEEPTFAVVILGPGLRNGFGLPSPDQVNDAICIMFFAALTSRFHSMPHFLQRRIP